MTQLRACLILMSIGLFASESPGGLYEDLYQGLGYFATPSGSPVSAASGGGSINGNRYGRLRIVPNDFGAGYRLELDRNFGTDTNGRAEVFDIGALELQLSGSTSATVQYTTNGVQTLNVDFYSNSLNYTLRDKTGIQDFEVNGVLNVAHQLEVNRFGFYTLDLEIDNTSAKLDSEGLVVEDETDTDFNIGPISVKGNVFVDAAAYVLNAVGVDATALEELFPKSGIDVVNEQISAALNEQYQVLSESYAAGLLDSDNSDASSGLLGQTGDFSDDSTLHGPTIDGVPESTSLLLIGTLALITLRRKF